MQLVEKIVAQDGDEEVICLMELISAIAEEKDFLKRNAV